jgi:hypothetical protein
LPISVKGGHDRDGSGAQSERKVPPSGAAAREAAAKSAQGDTAAAAQDILKSYRRPHK